MNNLLKIVISSLLCLTLASQAQNEFSKWYFGGQAGLDFSTSPPSVLLNSAMTQPEGVASISSPNGSLLFYTDGVNVFNSLHQIMANGTGLNGNTSSTQSAVIVKQPGTASLYYIFTTPHSYYSIVDMSLAAGLGSVTVKNTLLFTPSTEKQVAVRHCNGRDAWIINHASNSNEFRAFVLTSMGISSNAVVSAIGDNFVNAGIMSAGQLKISPDGRKLAMASYSTANMPSNGLGGFQLFDFDASTGIISNSVSLKPNVPGAYGMEFSADGSKLYGAVQSQTPQIFQWNVCASSSAAIVASEYSFSPGPNSTSSLQKGIDDKIYVTRLFQTFLGVINNPNASGAAMNFVQNGISIAPKQCTQGLPNFINGYTKNVPATFASTTACQSVSFSVPAQASFSSGCSAIPYPYSGYKWDFGEPASAANSSTVMTASHTYSALGTYTVKLIMYSNCENDTITKVVTVTAPGPSITVNGLFSICKGEKRVYTANGGTSYQWSNSSSTSTVALSPASTTVYSLTGTSGICKTTEVFTVTVNACAGVSEATADLQMKLYPNPAQAQVMIESLQSGEALIYDMQGKLLQQMVIKEGLNRVSLSGLLQGIYLVELRSMGALQRQRLIVE
jgi:PKD repeat protein